MKKIYKNTILILTIMICIICTILITQTLKTKKNKKEEENNNIQNIEGSFKKLEDYNIYYSLKGIIEDLVSNIKEYNGDEEINFERIETNKDETIKNLQEEAIENIYETFSNKYIEECNITKKDIEKEINKYKIKGDYSSDEEYKWLLKDIYITDINENLKLLLVNLSFFDDEYKIFVELDLDNETFQIYGKEYLDKKQYNENTNIDKIVINKNNIEGKEGNSFQYIEVNDKYIVNQYFSDFKDKILNDIDGAYNILEDEYREKKFDKNITLFMEYVKNNYEKFDNSNLYKYLVNNYEEYKEYVCIDEEGNYYIFLESGIDKYTVILDTYTIDLKEFIDKYNKSDDRTKVGMNIEKIIDAINDKDYKYAYSKLDSNFTKNNFSNINEFREYVEKNFYYENKIEYGEFLQNGNTYIYKCYLKSEEDEHIENEEKKGLTIIMKLLEENNYVMSFSIE